MKDLLVSSAMLAQDINLKDVKGFTGPAALEIPDLVSGFLKLTLILAGGLFFFYLVYGGIKWMMGSGDKAGTEGARNQITASLVGLTIVFSAWAIAALINQFFSVNIFELTIPKAGQN